jgi:hypothetical protein
VPAADVLVSHPSDGQRQKPVAGDETEEDWTLKVQ